MKSVGGFTLVEIMVVIGLFATLSALAAITLLRPERSARAAAVIDTLIADLKQQQIKAMLGERLGLVNPLATGVYIDGNRYILFSGNDYSPGDSNNFVVDFPGQLVLTTNFPSSIVFSRLSGEIVGFVDGSNVIFVTDESSGDQRTLTINRYGAVSVN